MNKGRAMSTLIEGLKLVTLGAARNIAGTHPDEVNETLLDFLAEWSMGPLTMRA
jgi:hypothetical protein